VPFGHFGDALLTKHTITIEPRVLKTTAGSFEAGVDGAPPAGPEVGMRSAPLGEPYP
jgi:hypothetical protein